MTPPMTLRADLLAVKIYDRLAAGAIAETTATQSSLKYLAEVAFVAATVFVREAKRRDPFTGERNDPGLPDGDDSDIEDDL